MTESDSELRERENGRGIINFLSGAKRQQLELLVDWAFESIFVLLCLFSSFIHLIGYQWLKHVE